MSRSRARSPYMEFSKLRSASKHNLATSGMASYPLAKLGMRCDQLEINGDNCYGYVPLKEAIAERYRVGVENVVTAAGTSMANHLALAGCTDVGDEILVEHPTYELILRTADYLGLRVRRFRRDPEDFSIDFADVERNLTPDVKLIVLCNMHNPSGAFTEDEALREIGRLAKKMGARVLVDEVYREMRWQSEPQTAFHLDPEVFISTNSLTKAYGLSGVRCGWILAAPELVERIWHINDLHGATPAYPAELISAVALERLAAVAEEQRALLDKNRGLLKAFLGSRGDLEFFWPEHGTVVFPRLKSGSVDELFELFRDKFDGTFVPGRFFEMPRHLRIGVGLPTDQIAPALEQLGRALSAANHAHKRG